MNASRTLASRVAVGAASSVATIALLVACRGNDGAGTTASPPDPPAAAAMTPGMVMPDGSTMGPAPASRPGKSAHGTRPSPTAAMVCGSEVRRDIATVLKLSDPPAGTAHWAHHTFTCSYQLPMGTLVLSVHESSDPATALRYARSTRHSLPRAGHLAGLTPTAFGTTDGRVVLVKDADTLTVNATGLPARFGTEGQKRADFGYELASDILGCWTGDDS